MPPKQASLGNIFKMRRGGVELFLLCNSNRKLPPDPTPYLATSSHNHLSRLASGANLCSFPMFWGMRSSQISLLVAYIWDSGSLTKGFLNNITSLHSLRFKSNPYSEWITVPGTIGKLQQEAGALGQGVSCQRKKHADLFLQFICWNLAS